MPSKSLGTLTLDLVAKVGGFEAGMDKASRKSKSTAKEIEKNLNSVVKTVAGLGVAAAGGLTVMTTNLAESAREIENLSRASNASTTEFQRGAFAVGRYGIETDKYADILKDTNDRIGDFLQTGGGPMADFFENVAPLVGVTADEFARLSGPEALQLYVSSLEKAGASQQEMTFYMEALASDATLLLPLLKNNGQELAALGDEAERTGNVLSDMDFEELRQITKSTDELQAAMKGVSNEVVLAAIPAVNDLTDLLGDQSTIDTAQLLGNAIVTSINGAVKAVKGAIEITQFLAEELAALTNGAAGDDIVRLEEQLQQAIELRSSSDPLSRTRLFGKGGIVEYWSDEELDAEITKLRKQIAAARDNMVNDLSRNPPVIELTDTSDVRASDDLLPGPGIPRSDDTTDDIEKEIEALRRQAEALDMTGDEAELYRLKMEGATPAQLEQAAAILKTITAYEDQVDAQKKAAEEMQRINDQAAQIQESLLSEEDQIKASYERRRQIVLENTLVTGEARADLLKKLDAKLYEDLQELNAGYWEKYLAATEENLQDFDELAGNMLENFTGRFGDAFEAMVFDAESLGDAIHGIAEGMARSVINALGEMAAQWLAYQAVQLVVGKTTKATAAAGMASTAAAQSAMAALNAYSSTAAIPVVGPAAAPAAAAAATAATAPLAATVASLSVAGMAHDGIDAVPQTGTWLLEKGERVTTADTSAKLDQTLDNVQKDMQQSQPAAGGQNIRIVNAFDTEVVGDYMGSDAGEKKIMNVVKRNQRTIRSLATG